MSETNRHKLKRRWLTRLAIRSSVAAVLVIMLVSIGVVLALPYIDYFRPQIEELISESTGKPLSIGRIDARWDSWNIALRLIDIELRTSDRRTALLELEDARVTIDPIASLRTRSLQPGNLTIIGATVVVTRNADGTFSAQGVSAPNAAETASASSASNKDEFSEWLLSQRRLSLESTTVVWINPALPSPRMVLSDVSLLATADQQTHTLQGTATLPSELGEQIAFDFKIEGDPRLRGWDAETRLDLQRVAVGNLLALRETSLDYEVEGFLDISVKASWHQARLTQANGGFRLDDVKWGKDIITQRLALMDGHYTLNRQSTGWLAMLNNVRVKTNNGLWPTTELSIRFTEPVVNEPDTQQFDIDASYLRLQDITPLSVWLDKPILSSSISQIGAQGDLTNVKLEIETAARQIGQVSISSDFSDVSVAKRDNRASVSGLRGRLKATRSQGRVDFLPSTVSLSVSDLFEEPLELTDVQGRIDWKSRGTGLWFDVHSIRGEHPRSKALKLRGKIHWPFGNPLPIVDVSAQAQTIDLSFITDYAVFRPFNRPFDGWLNHAVQAGSLSDFEVSFRGFAGDFPFDGAPNALRGKANIKDLNLSYSAAWPTLENASADLQLVDTNAIATSINGEVFGIKLSDSSALLSELNQLNPTLNLDANLTGTAQRGLDFLRSGPLKDRFGALASHLDVDGAAELDLKLSFALPRGKKTIDGDIIVAGATLSLDKTATVLNDVSGTLNFKNGGLFATDLTATYLATPIQIDIDNHPSKQTLTRLAISGKADRAFLTRQLHKAAVFADPADPPLILSQLSGAAAWQATLDVPNVNDGNVATRLSVTSDLVGLRSTLPPPFGKPINAVRKVIFDTEFSSAAYRNISIGYGTSIGSVFELQAQPDGFELTRGTIAFGDRKPLLSKLPGLHVTGSLAEISIDDWWAVMRAPRPTQRKDNPILKVLESVDVKAGTIEFLGNEFETSHIQLGKNTQLDWLLSVNSPALAGEIIFPAIANTGKPIVADLQRLRIAKPEASNGNQLNPKDMPAMDITCDDLTFQDVRVGAFRLSTAPGADGLSIKSLDINNAKYSAHATGNWSKLATGETTQLQARVSAQELGGIINAFGFDDEMSTGGQTELETDLAWVGAPSDFSLKSLKGTFQLKSKEGRLLEVSPGATGRMFGFLLMSSLPRRLRLDFSDVFDKGVEFDFIEGNFAIDGGHAYTNNLTLDSSSATIAVSGRTGIIDGDYDQVVTITPKVASSLPLAPIWLLEKLLDKPFFDKAFAFEYTVTGSWEDPIVERHMIDSEIREQ